MKRQTKKREKYRKKSEKSVCVRERKCILDMLRDREREKKEK